VNASAKCVSDSYGSGYVSLYSLSIKVRGLGVVVPVGQIVESGHLRQKGCPNNELKVPSGHGIHVFGLEDPTYSLYKPAGH